MSQDTNLPAPDDFDGDAPRPFIMPPPGPVVRWDRSPMDLLDWDMADAELLVHWKPGLGDMEAHGHLLASLLSVGIRNDLDEARELLDAIVDVRAGRGEVSVHDCAEYNTVAVRPDAVWLHYGHAYPGQDLRAFPLDGMEAVLRRWAEAIRKYDGDG